MLLCLFSRWPIQACFNLLLLCYRGLHDILIETGYWEQLGFDISMVAPVYKKLSSIRFVYESMVQVCIGYNKILRSLSDHEQQLYRYPLTLLEKKIAPGLNTLDWTHSVQDTYLKEVVTVTDEVSFRSTRRFLVPHVSYPLDKKREDTLANRL